MKLSKGSNFSTRSNFRQIKQGLQRKKKAGGNKLRQIQKVEQGIVEQSIKEICEYKRLNNGRILLSFIDEQSGISDRIESSKLATEISFESRLEKILHNKDFDQFQQIIPFLKNSEHEIFSGFKLKTTSKKMTSIPLDIGERGTLANYQELLQIWRVESGLKSEWNVFEESERVNVSQSSRDSRNKNDINTQNGFRVLFVEGIQQKDFVILEDTQEIGNWNNCGNSENDSQFNVLNSQEKTFNQLQNEEVVKVIFINPSSLEEQKDHLAISFPNKVQISQPVNASMKDNREGKIMSKVLLGKILEERENVSNVDHKYVMKGKITDTFRSCNLEKSKGIFTGKNLYSWQ